MYSLVTEEEGLLGWGRTLQCILVAAILEATVSSAGRHVQTYGIVTVCLSTGHLVLHDSSTMIYGHLKTCSLLIRQAVE